MRLAQEIIEIFEDYLEEKGIKIDNPEREQSGDNACQIYGTEYGDLEDKINHVLSGTECLICTNMGSASGKIEVNNEDITITSEQLDNYLEEYSME